MKKIVSKTAGIGDLFNVDESFSFLGDILNRILSSTSAINLMIRARNNGANVDKASSASTLEILEVTLSPAQLTSLRETNGITELNAERSGRKWKFTDEDDVNPFSPSQNVSARVLIDYLIGDRSANTYTYPNDDTSQIILAQSSESMFISAAEADPVGPQVTIPIVNSSGQFSDTDFIQFNDSGSNMLEDITFTSGDNLSTLLALGVVTDLEVLTASTVKLTLTSSVASVQYDGSSYTPSAATTGEVVYMDDIATNSTLILTVGQDGQDWGE